MSKVKRHLDHPWAARLERLESGRVGGVVVGTTKRFFDIGGLDLGALVAVELFTTVLPILLIAFAWFEHFSKQENIGELFLEQLGMHGSLASIVRSEFSTADELRRVWTFAGLASFLLWGIPMSLTVARVFAQAWQHPVHTVAQRLWRGSLWFTMYLLTLLVNHRIATIGSTWLHVALIPITVVISMLFWGCSPVVLVEGIRASWRLVLIAGAAGFVINAIMRDLVVRIVFPLLLRGWDGFGPIGVAFTMMTWCGVTGVVWVVIACAGAVLHERSVARRDEGGPLGPPSQVAARS